MDCRFGKFVLREIFSKRSIFDKFSTNTQNHENQLISYKKNICSKKSLKQEIQLFHLAMNEIEYRR